MSGIEFDMSEVEALAADLAAAAAKVTAKLRPAVQADADKVKKGMQSDFGGIGHAPYFPASITFETRVTADGVEAEVGPDKGRPQGALGNILAFGTVKNGPVADITRSARAAAPDLEKLLGQIGTDALDG